MTNKIDDYYIKILRKLSELTGTEHEGLAGEIKDVVGDFSLEARAMHCRLQRYDGQDGMQALDEIFLQVDGENLYNWENDKCPNLDDITWCADNT